MFARVLVFRRFFPILAFLLLYQIARGMTLPLFPEYYKAVNLTATDIGIVIAAYGVSFLIFEALWGFAFERFGTRGAVPPIAIALTSVAILLFARPNDLAQVVGAEALLGLGLGGAGVFPRLVIAHLTKYEDRGQAFGMLGFTYSIGVTVGSLMAGIAGTLIGISRSFIISAVICAASMIPIWLANRTPSSYTEDISDAPVAKETTNSLPLRSNNRGFIVLGFVGLVAAGANGFYTLLFPNELLREPKIAATTVEISLVIALYNLFTGLMQPVVGSFGSKRPVSWIIGCLLGTGGCYFALIFAENVAQVGIITIVMSVIYSAITPLALSLLTNFATKNRWGRYIGIYGAAEDVGIVITSSLGSVVWGIYGYQYSLLMMASIFASVGLLCFLAARGGILRQNSRPIDSIRD